MKISLQLTTQSLIIKIIPISPKNLHKGADQFVTNYAVSNDPTICM